MIENNTMSIHDSKIPWNHRVLMELYESSTGNHSLQLVNDGIHGVYIEVWHYAYIDWLAERVEGMLDDADANEGYHQGTTW